MYEKVSLKDIKIIPLYSKNYKGNEELALCQNRRIIMMN
jgi:hypothetical protein